MVNPILQTQSPQAQILPSAQLSLIHAEHVRSGMDVLRRNRQAAHFAPGLAGLLQAFGPSPAPAALRADCLEADPTHRYVALEPCFWRIEPGGLRWMAHGAALALSAQESDQLFNELSTVFTDTPAQLQRNKSGEFFLRCEPTLAAPAALYPELLLGAEMKAHVPHLTFWQRWLNEAQMQLATSELNQHRVQRGALPINSVWFWGGEPIAARGAVLALNYHGADPVLRARAALPGQGAAVQVYDWRALDLATFVQQLQAAPAGLQLLCGDGYLYQKQVAASFWQRLRQALLERGKR